LEKALVRVWERELGASGVVVDAERSHIAAAIVAEASAWGADVIVMTQRPRRALGLGLWSKVCRRVVRQARCPVLLVYEAGA
jgi:nucleotide-binding universal stress UspA family protein